MASGRRDIEDKEVAKQEIIENISSKIATYFQESKVESNRSFSTIVELLKRLSPVFAEEAFVKMYILFFRCITAHPHFGAEKESVVSLLLVLLPLASEEVREVRYQTIKPFIAKPMGQKDWDQIERGVYEGKLNYDLDIEAKEVTSCRVSLLNFSQFTVKENTDQPLISRYQRAS